MPVAVLRTRTGVPVERGRSSGVRVCEEVPQTPQTDLRHRRRPLLEPLRVAPLRLSNQSAHRYRSQLSLPAS